MARPAGKPAEPLGCTKPGWLPHTAKYTECKLYRNMCVEMAEMHLEGYVTI